MLMLSVEPVALNEETLTVALEICTTCITSACFALTILDFSYYFFHGSLNVFVSLVILL
jgi:hypothetical protein